jgi:hypothetical protein
VLLLETWVGRRKGHIEAGLRSTPILADSAAHSGKKWT